MCASPVESLADPTRPLEVVIGRLECPPLRGLAGTNRVRWLALRAVVVGDLGRCVAVWLGSPDLTVTVTVPELEEFRPRPVGARLERPVHREC